MWKRGILLVSLIATNTAILAQVGRVGPAVVVDPSGTIAASRDTDGPPQPTPRLADGTVNLGRDHGEKGIWGLPSIQNFAGFTPDTPKEFNRGQRGGAPNEPFIPFQPWAAAVYNYNSLNEGKYDPEGFCFPPGGPRSMGTPFPAEIIQLPEQKRILIIYEGGTHVWREIFMDGRPIRLATRSIARHGWAIPSADGKAIRSSLIRSVSTKERGSISGDIRTQIFSISWKKSRGRQSNGCTTKL